MTNDIRVKICGLSTPETIAVAAEAGATYVGFVFFAKSPRYVTIDAARDLALGVPDGIAKVALVVDATNEFLDELTSKVPLDVLQLHGRETPARVSEIKARYGLPVMKAVGVADADDLPALAEYEAVADQLLVDTKAPKSSDRPGGNALTFDWGLIAGRTWAKPWMLAGGLTADNVAEAIKITGARQVDLSSAVESAPGVKDPGLIRAFIAAAQAI
ncbi:MAG: phosphoribosylanthranilate isomerase [Roseovarius sp.]|nr:phosphoribosylanthranilate isomerase [Roseovarius sp.]